MFICDITKSAFFTHISLTVNYHLFTHSEVRIKHMQWAEKRSMKKKNDTGLTIPAVACLT